MYDMYMEQPTDNAVFEPATTEQAHIMQSETPALDELTREYDNKIRAGLAMIGSATSEQKRMVVYNALFGLMDAGAIWTKMARISPEVFEKTASVIGNKLTQIASDHLGDAGFNSLFTHLPAFLFMMVGYGRESSLKSSKPTIGERLINPFFGNRYRGLRTGIALSYTVTSMYVLDEYMRMVSPNVEKLCNAGSKLVFGFQTCRGDQGDVIAYSIPLVLAGVWFVQSIFDERAMKNKVNTSNDDPME
jgi:hypothetical protein